MKIAILNDTHCGVRNSSEIYLNHAENFYSKVFFPECEKRGVKQILHLGDYYDHRKFINFKALNHNRKIFLNVLRDKGMTMDIIPGNHDTYFKNTNKLNSLKELLGHYMNEVNIVMEPTVMDYGSLKMALVPWICQDNYEQTMNFIKECKADWLGAHLELNGFELMRGVKMQEGMDAKLFEKFEQVISGHFHVASEQGNIRYLGSQMEFTWADCGDKKYFHVLDTETRQIEKVENPYTLFKKVVYNDEKTNYNIYNTAEFANHFVKVVVANRTDTFTFDRFIDRIQQENILDLKIAENFNEFIGENVDDEGLDIDDTPKLVDDYIEGVDTDLDKEKIKIMMRELMSQAQALEIA
jgi:DNA repair exonuclease SbcCD nuclease subunit